MAELLKQFLKDTITKEFEWGQCDCGLWVCDWIELNTGEDPGKDLRGTYTTELGCGKLLVKSKGVEGLLADRIPPLADRVYGRNALGDIAVIDMPNVGAALTLRTPIGWAVKNMGNGYTVYGPINIRFAWRLKCLQQ